MENTFEKLITKTEILQQLQKIGYEQPTEVQSAVIPVALLGKDLSCQAKTGTGKTAAFSLPILERIDKKETGIKALVLAPTRELALQITNEMREIGRLTGLHIVCVYGGESIEKQVQLLRRGAQIVIATPGRLLDLQRRGAIHMNLVNTFVLDEADKMLEMGFIEDVEKIMRFLPHNRQTMVFSATMPHQIHGLVKRFLKNPEHINHSQDSLTVDTISQYYVFTRHDRKIETMRALFEDLKIDKALIFCRTQRTVSMLEYRTRFPGYRIIAMHGGMKQNQREARLKEFHTLPRAVLIATNLVSRGIHIDDISHVINYDFPQDKETYLHRIGRTGRQGKQGTSITLLTSAKEHQELEDIARKAHTQVTELGQV